MLVGSLASSKDRTSWIGCLRKSAEFFCLKLSIQIQMYIFIYPFTVCINMNNIYIYIPRASSEH